VPPMKVFRPVANDDVTVDVVLPTPGQRPSLGCAIESVLNQTHDSLRLHVVGDGCGPETEAAVAAFGDPRVRFHAFPKGRGFGYANRNVVLRGLAGPYVAYMTDDDLLLSDHLEIAIRELGASGADLVALRPCAVHYPDTLDPHFFAFTWQHFPGARILRRWFMGSINCVHRLDLFRRVGYWNGALSRFGDREFYNRARRGARTRYVDRVTILRFYALHWDGRYAALDRPPQARYLERVGDPAWIDALRRAAEQRPGWSSRRRQLGDFLRFGLASGPRFARFWLEQLASRRRLAPSLPDAAP